MTILTEALQPFASSFDDHAPRWSFRRLVDAYCSSATLQHLAQEAPMSLVDRFLGRFGSYARTDHMTMLMLMAPARRSLSIFLDWGNMCDCPWPWRSVLADKLRSDCSQVSLAEVLPAAEQAWLAALPPVIEVFRGCERGRERGLHWTTDYAVAEGFARGKRCVNLVPTLARARIPKKHIFCVFLDRRESEVVLDPRRLRRLSSAPYSPPDPPLPPSDAA
jgi:hypothetical protein